MALAAFLSVALLWQASSKGGSSSYGSSSGSYSSGSYSSGTSSSGSASRGSYAGGGVTHSLSSYHNNVGAYAAVAMMSSGSRRRYGSFHEPWLVFAACPSEKLAVLENLIGTKPDARAGLLISLPTATTVSLLGLLVEATGSS